MLNIIKQNISTIIVFLILILIGVKGIYSYILMDNIHFSKENEIYEKCNGIIPDDSNLDKAICNRYKEKPQKRDALSTFGYITQNEGIENLQIGAPLLIMIVAASIFYKLIRNGYLKNAIVRIDYNSAIKKIYFKTLKCIFVMPLFLLIIFIVSCIISGNFNYSYGVSHYLYDAFGTSNVKNIFLFLIFYFTNFVLHSIFWVNIIVYNTKYNKNIILCIIASYIEYMLFLIFLENIALMFMPVNKIFSSLVLPIIWTYSDGASIYSVFIFSLILVLLSTLIVYESYKNKEIVLEEISK